MKKKFFWMIVVTTILISFFVYINPQEKVSAEENEPSVFATNALLKNYPSMNVVNPLKPEAAPAIPGDYATVFRMNPKISYTVVGNTREWKSDDNYARFDANDSYSSKEHYVLVKNIAIYQGNYVDMKINVKDVTGSYIRVYTVKNGVGKPDEFLEIDLKSNGTKADIQYEFYKSGTNEMISLKGMWNIKRLNRRKSMVMSTKESFLKGMYTYSSSDILYSDLSGNRIFVVGQGNGEDPNTEFTYLFSSSGVLNHSLTLEESATAWLKYDTQSITRVMMPSPQIIGETNEDSTKISYTVVQDMPKQSNQSWYLKNYVMYLNADEIFDLSTGNIKVTDMMGNNATSKFTITKDVANNRFVATLPSSTLSDDSFVDNSYFFQITGNVKEGIDKEKYYKSDGYLHIPMTVYNVTPDGESTHNSSNAKTKLGGQPTGNPVSQEVMVGSSTADLDPTKLVKDLKGVFASESVSFIGFEADKTFSTLGSDSVVVTIKGDKSGLLGKVNVPITVINYSNPTITTKIVSEIKQADGTWLSKEEGVPEDSVRFTVTSEITNDVSRWTASKLLSTIDSLYENITPISAQVVSDGKTTALAVPTLSGNVMKTQDDAPMLANKGAFIQMVYIAQVKKANTASKDLKTTVTTQGTNPDKTTIAIQTAHTFSVKDVEPPTAKSKVTPVALNDSNAILGATVDLKSFLTDVADNVSTVDKIKAELVGNQDIPTLVSTVGVKEISIRLTDEAGNAAIVKMQIFVYDKNWPVGKDGAVTGQDFVMDQKDWSTDTARQTVVTNGTVQGFDISGEVAIDVTNDPSKLVIDTSKVGTEQGKAYPIKLTVNDATKTITVTFKDTIAPTGTGKMTIVDLNDAKAITDASDYSVFLSDWSDNVSKKEKIKISLAPNQEIATLVSKIGRAEFTVQLEDEAGNIGVVAVPIFVKDPEDVPSKDKKYVLSGHDFSVAAVDYPTSEEAIIQMIREKGEVKLYETETGIQLPVEKVQINKMALPAPNSGTTLAPAGNYEVTLSYGSGDSSVTKKIVVTVVKSVGTINVEFLDEKGVAIQDPVQVGGIIGESVDLSTNSAIKNAITVVEQKNYDLDKRPADEKSVLIKREGTTVQYHFKGILKIASKPAMLDFGTKSVGNATTKVDKATYDTPLVIWDNRADLTSWTLTAQLEDSLRSQADTTKVLPEAIRYKVDNDKTVPLSVGTAQPITVHTHTNPGEYNISSEWDKGESGFQLEIPAGGVRKLGEYQTTILWQLGQTP